MGGSLVVLEVMGVKALSLGGSKANVSWVVMQRSMMSSDELRLRPDRIRLLGCLTVFWHLAIQRGLCRGSRGTITLESR